MKANQRIWSAGGVLVREIVKGLDVEVNIGKTMSELGLEFSNQNKVKQSKNQWPWWAQWLASRATPEDKGVGDVVARMIGHEKSLAFKAWFKATFGKDCGCNGRQARWNRQYPLNE